MVYLYQVNVADRNRVLKRPRARSLSTEYKKGLDKRHSVTVKYKYVFASTWFRQPSPRLSLCNAQEVSTHWHGSNHVSNTGPPSCWRPTYSHVPRHNKSSKELFLQLSFAVKTGNIYQQQ